MAPGPPARSADGMSFLRVDNGVRASSVMVNRDAIANFGSGVSSIHAQK
jgi:hypothetical protein